MSRVCISGITDYAGFDISADTDEVGYINPIRYRGYYYDNETGVIYGPPHSVMAINGTLTEEQKKFVSTVAGEAIGHRNKEAEAVAHTIMNRFHEPRDAWSYVTSVTDVLIPSQYDAVGSDQYNFCMEYLNNRDGGNALYENIINIVIPIYYGEKIDFTGGAHYIFNIYGSSKLWNDLKKQPERYIECGPCEGVDSSLFKMYRCLY